MPELKWRVGGKVPLNVYEGDRPMFQCHTPEDAARVVGLLNAAEEVEKLRADKERLDLLLRILNERGIDGLDKWLMENTWRPHLAFDRQAIDAARSLQTNGRVPESTAEAKQEASPARKEKADA